MEQTNAATSATKTHQLVENFFDAFDHTNVLLHLELMSVEYLASEAHCGISRQQRNQSAAFIFSLQHFMKNLHAAQSPPADD